MILIDRQLQGHFFYLLAEVRPFCGSTFFGPLAIRSLHHASRIRNRLRNHSSFFAETDFGYELSLPRVLPSQS